MAYVAARAPDLVRPNGGRLLNRSLELAERRARFSTTGTVDDLSMAALAPREQVAEFDQAIGDMHDAVGVANHDIYGDPLPAHLPGGAVQLRARLAQRHDPDEVRAVAAAGIGGRGSELPHAPVIRAAFGRHDIDHIEAHVGGDAGDAADAIGARAYASGEHVAFAGAPDLFTAAHEAAHVVQQRAGVALAGGVGQSGDAYERHADEVARAVVSGGSAEALLDAHGGGGGGPAVQCADGPKASIESKQTSGNVAKASVSEDKAELMVGRDITPKAIKKGFSWALWPPIGKVEGPTALRVLIKPEVRLGFNAAIERKEGAKVAAMLTVKAEVTVRGGINATFGGFGGWIEGFGGGGGQTQIATEVGWSKDKGFHCTGLKGKLVMYLLVGGEIGADVPLVGGGDDNQAAIKTKIEWHPGGDAELLTFEIASWSERDGLTGFEAHEGKDVERIRQGMREFVGDWDQEPGRAPGEDQGPPLEGAGSDAMPEMHHVVKGDTLSRIAAVRLGDVSRWPEIAELNAIPNPDRIEPGMVLQLPAGGAGNDSQSVTLTEREVDDWGKGARGRGGEPKHAKRDKGRAKGGVRGKGKGKRRD